MAFALIAVAFNLAGDDFVLGGEALGILACGLALGGAALGVFGCGLDLALGRVGAGSGVDAFLARLGRVGAGSGVDAFLARLDRTGISGEARARLVLEEGSGRMTFAGTGSFRRERSRGVRGAGLGVLGPEARVALREVGV